LLAEHRPAIKAERLLAVLGIDLDVQSKVANVLLWQPFLELIEEIRDEDPSARRG
jgi:hypothetical protein